MVALYGLAGYRAIPPPERDATSIGDTQLQLRTIERIRRGESYYAAVGDELRKNQYPTLPIINWRTPLHYSMVAALSVPGAGALLAALCFAAVITAGFAYAPHSLAKALIASALLLWSLAPAILTRPGSVGFPEHWAAVFIALSLNAYVARRFSLGAVLGIIAVFLRELAAPYALGAAVLALFGRRRTECYLWIAGGILYLVYFAIHAATASAAVTPDDLVREHSYARWLGLPFVFMTLYANGIFNLLPPALTPIGASLGLSALWAESAAAHIKAAVAIYFALFLMIGQPFNFYWGYLTSPIWAYGLLHAPDGVVKLMQSALGRDSRLATDLTGSLQVK